MLIGMDVEGMTSKNEMLKKHELEVSGEEKFK